MYVEHHLSDNMMDDVTTVVKALDFKKAFDPSQNPSQASVNSEMLSLKGARNPLAEIQ